MSVDVIIVAAIIAIAAFFAGAIVGYGMRVREEQDAYRDERIIKHWHGHTSHKGCTIFSPEVREGGIK